MKTEEEIKQRLQKHTELLDDLNLEFDKIHDDKGTPDKNQLAYLRSLIAKQSAIVNVLGWVLDLNEYN